MTAINALNPYLGTAFNQTNLMRAMDAVAANEADITYADGRRDVMTLKGRSKGNKLSVRVSAKGYMDQLTVEWRVDSEGQWMKTYQPPVVLQSPQTTTIPAPPAYSYGTVSVTNAPVTTKPPYTYGSVAVTGSAPSGPAGEWVPLGPELPKAVVVDLPIERSPSEAPGFEAEPQSPWFSPADLLKIVNSAFSAYTVQQRNDIMQDWIDRQSRGEKLPVTKQMAAKAGVFTGQSPWLWAGMVAAAGILAVALWKMRD